MLGKMNEECPQNISDFDPSTLDYYRKTYTLKSLDGGDYVKIVACVVVIVGGLFGNACVFLTVLLNKSMRNTIDIYIANLAIADFMICICCLLVHMVNLFTQPVYVFGAFMCKFNNFMQTSCLTCSVLTLSAISCDRFIAILFPLHARFTKQRPSLVIALIWGLSLVVSTPSLVVRKLVIDKYRDFVETQCVEMWPTEEIYEPQEQICIKHQPLRLVYYTFASALLFFVPVAIMITAYSLILCKLWRSRVPGEQCAANTQLQERSRKKVLKMVLVVLIAFILCWMPFQVIVLYSEFKPHLTALPSWFREFEWFAYFIAYANSFMNPIIYGGYNESFRESICLILKCELRRQTFVPNPSQRSRSSYKINQTIKPALSSLEGTGGKQVHITKNGSIEAATLCSSNNIIDNSIEKKPPNDSSVKK